jgi:Na+/H+ antiporter NhaB
VNDAIGKAKGSCVTILGEIENVRADLHAARRIQETVYNSFQKVTSRTLCVLLLRILQCLSGARCSYLQARGGGGFIPAAVAAKTDARDMIRAMPK